MNIINFHSMQLALLDGNITKEELFYKILHLPCLYTLLHNVNNIFYLELAEDEQSEQLLTVLPLYSSFEGAMKALEDLGIIGSEYAESLIIKWDDIHELFNLYDSLDLDSVAFDLSLTGDYLEGLIFKQGELLDELKQYLQKG